MRGCALITRLVPGIALALLLAAPGQANTNFDTGEPAHVHDYALADETHAEWLEALAKRKFAGAPPAVRRTLDTYYRNAPAPHPRDRKARKAWQRTQEELARLNP